MQYTLYNPTNPALIADETVENVGDLADAVRRVAMGRRLERKKANKRVGVNSYAVGRSAQ